MGQHVPTETTRHNADLQGPASKDRQITTRPHGTYITGTARAFHEEARAARLTSPAAEATDSKSVQARFESGVSLHAPDHGEKLVRDLARLGWM